MMIYDDMSAQWWPPHGSGQKRCKTHLCLQRPHSRFISTLHSDHSDSIWSISKRTSNCKYETDLMTFRLLIVFDGAVVEQRLDPGPCFGSSCGCLSACVLSLR